MNAPSLVEQEAAVVVAVPGDRRRSAPCSRIASIVATRFSVSIGFGTPFGNVPSGS